MIVLFFFEEELSILFITTIFPTIVSTLPMQTWLGLVAPLFKGKQDEDEKIKDFVQICR